MVVLSQVFEVTPLLVVVACASTVKMFLPLIVSVMVDEGLSCVFDKFSDCVIEIKSLLLDHM